MMGTIYHIAVRNNVQCSTLLPDFHVLQPRKSNSRKDETGKSGEAGKAGEKLSRLNQVERKKQVVRHDADLNANLSVRG